MLSFILHPCPHAHLWLGARHERPSLKPGHLPSNQGHQLERREAHASGYQSPPLDEIRTLHLSATDTVITSCFVSSGRWIWVFELWGFGFYFCSSFVFTATSGQLWGCYMTKGLYRVKQSVLFVRFSEVCFYLKEYHFILPINNMRENHYWVIMLSVLRQGSSKSKMVRGFQHFNLWTEWKSLFSDWGDVKH